MKKLMVLAALLAVLATACRAEVLMGLDVQEDGSGSMTMEVGVDEELQGLLEMGGGSPDDLLGDLSIDAPEGAETTQRTEGDMTYYGVKIDFADPAELEKFMTEGGNDAFEEFALVVDDGGAELRARMNVPTQDLGDAPFDPSQITDEFFSAKFVVSLPGKVVESNADETLPDGRLVWDLPITGGEKEVFARSETGGGALTLLWIILGVILVIAIAVAVVIAVLRNQQPDRAIDEASDADALAGDDTTSDDATNERAADAVEEPRDGGDPEGEGADGDEGDGDEGDVDGETPTED